MVFRFFRKKVSGDKKRYVQRSTLHDFDVDLTYITERIIAMSFPANGLESSFRNDIDEVSELLDNFHKDHYFVYNLSERKYDYNKFHNYVKNWCGWPDHHAPPILLLVRSIKSIYKYLSQNDQNVVSVHCLAGKGRTGTLICSFFLFTGLFDNPQDARRFFANKRSLNNWGVSGPAQIRAVDWFSDLLKSGKPPLNKPLKLNKLTINKVPLLSLSPGKQGLCPIITIYDFNYKGDNFSNVIWTNKITGKQPFFERTEENIVFNIDTVVRGDLLIIIEHAALFGTEIVCRLSYHTAMVTSSDYTIKFQKNQIDVAWKDRRFPYDFALDFQFSPLPSDINLPISWIEEDEYAEKLWNFIFSTTKSNGSICYFPCDSIEDKIKQEKKPITKTGGLPPLEGGGYLTKLGHNVKNWKRRWFVLHPDRIEYYTKPNATSPQGIIYMKDITAVHELQGDANQNPKNVFIIWTVNNNYTCYADSEEEREEWIESIENCMNKFEESNKEVIGHLSVQLLQANDLILAQSSNDTEINSYGIISVGKKSIKTDIVKNTSNPLYDKSSLETEYRGEGLDIQIINSNNNDTEIIGKITVNMEFDIDHEEIYRWNISTTESETGSITVFLRFKVLKNYNEKDKRKAFVNNELILNDNSKGDNNNTTDNNINNNTILYNITSKNNKSSNNILTNENNITTNNRKSDINITANDNNITNNDNNNTTNNIINNNITTENNTTGNNITINTNASTFTDNISNSTNDATTNINDANTKTNITNDTTNNNNMTNSTNDTNTKTNITNDTTNNNNMTCNTNDNINNNMTNSTDDTNNNNMTNNTNDTKTNITNDTTTNTNDIKTNITNDTNNNNVTNNTNDIKTNITNDTTNNNNMANNPNNINTNNKNIKTTGRKWTTGKPNKTPQFNLI